METSMTTQYHRRDLVRAFAAMAGTGLFPQLSRAADYPDRPIKFVVPFNAGGNVDGVGRLLAAAMGPLLGQPVVLSLIHI